MDVFGLRDRLVDEYRAYVGSFVNVRDERIQQLVERAFDGGAFWPEPLIQLNPAFAAGARIDELVDQGVLHPTCNDVFRAGKSASDPLGRALRLHRHQEDAVRVAAGGHDYVLTTGTGSGKSLAYIVPIVDHVLRHGSGRGVQAIVV